MTKLIENIFGVLIFLSLIGVPALMASKTIDHRWQEQPALKYINYSQFVGYGKICGGSNFSERMKMINAKNFETNVNGDSNTSH